MNERMTVDEALEAIADETMVLGPPFDANPMARAGKALHDEIERLRENEKALAGVGDRLIAENKRLRECVKQRDMATTDGDKCSMCGSPRLLRRPSGPISNGCYPTCPKELYPLDPGVTP